MVLKVYIIGGIILFLAVFINIAAIYLKIDTWYSFLEEGKKIGLYKAFINLSLFSKLFLFIIYPLILGFPAYIAPRFIK